MGRRNIVVVRRGNTKYPGIGVNVMLFATLKNYQKVYLLEANIGSMIITGAQVKETERVLGLDDLETENDLRAMRNAVVRFLANAKDEYFDEESGEFIDSKKYFQLNANMSGIVCVIDNKLFHMGYEV